MFKKYRFILITILLLVFGVGGFKAYGYFSTPNNPQKIVESYLDSLKNDKIPNSDIMSVHLQDATNLSQSKIIDYKFDKVVMGSEQEKAILLQYKVNYVATNANPNIIFALTKENGQFKITAITKNPYDN